MKCPLCQFQNSGEVRLCGGCGKPLESSSIGDLSMEATFLGSASDPGAVVGARYELVQELGRGGMGVVFKATDTKLGRRAVSIKRLFLSDERGVERFLREAEAIASLSHANIRAIHDQAEDEHGPFLVMEYVEGESLRDLVSRTGGLDDEEFLRLALELAAALSHAHAAGIIHRDVKPGNVLLTRTGQAKLTDFGLARIGTDSELSITGQGMGTLDYTSPEQREDAKRADERSDVFGLGATMYFMLTGESPRTVREGRLPGRWRALVMRCLEERPDRRFESMPEIREALETAASTGHSASGDASLVAEDLPATPRRRRPKWLMPLAVVALLLAGGAYASLSMRNASVIERANEALIAGHYPEIPGLLADLGPGPQDSERIDFLESRAVIAAELARLWGSTDLPSLVDEGLQNDLIRDEPRLRGQYDEVVLNEARASFKDADFARASELTDRLTPDSKQAAQREELLRRITWGRNAKGRWPKEQTNRTLPETVLKSALDPASSQADVESRFNQELLDEVHAQIKVQAFEAAQSILDCHFAEAGHDDEAAALGGHLALATQLQGTWRHGELPQDVVELLVLPSPSSDEAKKAYNAALESLALEALLSGDPTESQRELDARVDGVAKSESWLALEWRPALWAELLRRWPHGELPESVVAALKDQTLDKSAVEVPYNEEVLVLTNAALASLKFEDMADALDLLVGAGASLRAPYEWREPLLVELRSKWTHADLSAGVLAKLTAADSTEEDVKGAYEDALNDLAVRPPELTVDMVETLRASGYSLTVEMVDIVNAAGRPLTAEMVDVLSNANRPLTPEMVDALTTADRPLTREMVEVLLADGRRTTAQGEPLVVRNSIGVDLIGLPGGVFQMGSTGGQDNEKPVHQVTLSRAFYLGRTEVTQAQWKEVMGSNPSNNPGEAFPVEMVSWEDAMRFCADLTDKEHSTGALPKNEKYTLPTEAQWEYACRAGTTTEYSFGDAASELGQHGWFKSNSGGHTHAVSTRNANPWGFDDMHGNVYEWCSDLYDSGYYANSPESDPSGPINEMFRVLRSGSCGDGAAFLRAASRSPFTPQSRVGFFGFRLARVSTQ